MNQAPQYNFFSEEQREEQRQEALQKTFGIYSKYPSYSVDKQNFKDKSTQSSQEQHKDAKWWAEEHSKALQMIQKTSEGWTENRKEESRQFDEASRKFERDMIITNHMLAALFGATLWDTVLTYRPTD